MPRLIRWSDLVDAFVTAAGRLHPRIEHRNRLHVQCYARVLSLHSKDGVVDFGDPGADGLRRHSPGRPISGSRRSATTTVRWATACPRAPCARRDMGAFDSLAHLRVRGDRWGGCASTRSEGLPSALPHAGPQAHATRKTHRRSGERRNALIGEKDRALHIGARPSARTRGRRWHSERA